jgi:hypothetical protein
VCEYPSTRQAAAIRRPDLPFEIIATLFQTLERDFEDVSFQRLSLREAGDIAQGEERYGGGCATFTTTAAKEATAAAEQKGAVCMCRTSESTATKEP